MATAKVKVYPYLEISPDAQEVNLRQSGWMVSDRVHDNGYMDIALPMIELEVEVPDDVRPACVQLLRQARGERTSQHQMLMTRFQFQENQLLGLAAPDVVEAPSNLAPNQSYHWPTAEGADDDIPF